MSTILRLSRNRRVRSEDDVTRVAGDQQDRAVGAAEIGGDDHAFAERSHSQEAVSATNDVQPHAQASARDGVVNPANDGLTGRVHQTQHVRLRSVVASLIRRRRKRNSDGRRYAPL